MEENNYQKALTIGGNGGDSDDSELYWHPLYRQEANGMMAYDPANFINQIRSVLQGESSDLENLAK